MPTTTIRHNKKRLLSALVGLLVSSVSAGALAVEYRADVGVTSEHTDNVRLDANEQSDLETTALVRLGLGHEGPTVKADMDYRFEKSWYKEATDLDESSIQGDTTLNWEALAKRLFLDVQHSQRNVVRDSADVDISSNREDRSILTVAPSYVLRLGSVDTVRTRVGWTNVRYEDTDASDSDRYSVDLSWLHALSKVDSLSVNAGTTQVDTDAGEASDYRYDYVTVGYQASLSRLSYTARVGVNRADREAGLDDVDGVLVDVEAEYRSGFQNWNLLARHAISDSSIGNDNDVLEDLERRDEFAGQVDVLEETVLQLDWSTEGLCERCVLRVGAFAEKNAYEVRTEDDSVELGALVGFNYRMSRQGTLGLSFSHRAVDYDDDLARDDYDENNIRLSYDHRLGQNLRLGLFVGQRERNSDNAGPDYDELRGGISLSYRFLP